MACSNRGDLQGRQPLLAACTQALVSPISEAVKQIQQHASDIQQETQASSLAIRAGRCAVTNHQRASELRWEAQRAARQAEQRFQELAAAADSVGEDEPGHGAEQWLRMQHQKLEKDLQTAEKSVEERWAEHEAAEVFHVTKPQRSVASVPEVTEAAPVTSPLATELEALGVCREGDADSVGGNLGLQQTSAVRQDVFAAEAETHDWYVGQTVAAVTRIAIDTQLLAQMMNDVNGELYRQGETADLAAVNIQVARDSTAMAVPELHGSIGRQRLGNKCLLYLCVLAFVLCLLVVVILELKHQ